MRVYQTTLAALGTLLAVLVAAWTVVMIMLVSQPAPEPVRLDLGRIILPAEIQEDDPLWDCRTMGNRVCGEVQP